MKKSTYLISFIFLIALFTSAPLHAQLSVQLGANINSARFEFEDVDQTPTLSSFTHLNAGLHYTNRYR